jgi:hypothetical protein
LAAASAFNRKPPGYELRTLDGEVDADRFERMLAVAEAAMQERRFASASSTLRKALLLVHGPLLGECRDDPFAQAEVARLEAMKVRAVERRVDADLALGRHADLVGEIEGLVAAHALHERFREQLMLALYRSSRQADALSAYQDAYQVLAGELGLVPGPGLRSMEAAILHQDPAIGYVSPEPETGLIARDRLPFVGRMRARQVLDTAWRRARNGERQLVVVEGDSGIGKTRLATEMAAAAESEGGKILLGRAVGDALVPFFPFVEALSPYAARLDPNQLRSIAGPGAPYLAYLLPGLPASDRHGRRGEAEASSHRYLMFEAVVAVLGAIAAPAGAVLILDDLHQADPSTMQLLEHVARHQSRARLLIIGTVTTPSPVAGVLSDLTAGDLPGRITLDGLSSGEVSELLVAVTGRNGGTPIGLARAITQQVASGPQPPQDKWLSPGTQLVTLTVGGNDASFAEVMATCVFIEACQVDWQTALNLLIPQLGNPLASLYESIAIQAPNATIIVMGYPRFFPVIPPLACSTGLGLLLFVRPQMVWINSEIQSMDNTIANAVATAQQHGYKSVRYVRGSYDALSGHEMCTDDPYYNVFVPSLSLGFSSFHPNQSGNAQMAQLAEQAYQAP